MPRRLEIPDSLGQGSNVLMNGDSGKAMDSTFGRQPVTADERKKRIRRVFDDVAARYDLMNDLMSFGIHRLWKRRLAADLPGRGLFVDLAGGTGDVAALLMRGAGRQVLVIDPSMPMMNEGRRKHEAMPIRWLAGEAEQLPLPDASADGLAVAFGLRNATCLEAALAETVRVLKPGGAFACLEFSRPLEWLRPFYEPYSFHVIPRLGAWVAGNPAAYRYLVESIRNFPDQQGFVAMLEAAGLAAVGWRNLSFGIACIHRGIKPPA